MEATVQVITTAVLNFIKVKINQDRERFAIFLYFQHPLIFGDEFVNLDEDKKEEECLRIADELASYIESSIPEDNDNIYGWFLKEAVLGYIDWLYIVKSLNGGTLLEDYMRAFVPDIPYLKFSNSLTGAIAFLINSHLSLLDEFRFAAAGFKMRIAESKIFPKGTTVTSILGDYIQRKLLVNYTPFVIDNEESGYSMLLAIIVITGLSCVNWKQVAEDILLKPDDLN
ncbi:hypothetical protein FD723_40215 (plasmid) [Nostoc sp. C052]|uniref:hypothetical protein n=1 Tax=Nostoc sp. C052 TaxID=2576902 RepID=UPI0015C3D393|nr:hypothetical protein [Nostoc sp. C052]QLE46439.1 hypothetical protein FD723_40215 [Nostoc sp. C052]